jgi:hypothetical protein
VGVLAAPDDARADIAAAAALRRAELADQPPCDVVVVRGGVPARRAGAVDALRRAASALAPGGRIVLLADVRTSPLRLADRLSGRRSRRGSTSLTVVRRAAADAGLEVDQCFGLLRSSEQVGAAFDLGCPAVGRLVLGETAVRSEGLRRRALGLLAHAAATPLGCRLVPSLLVVLHRIGAAPVAERRTGLLALNPDKQRLVLMGEPPHSGEKYYRSSADAAREADALRRLDRSPLVPRLLGRPTPHHVSFAWLPGHVLPVRQLAAAELVAWTARAASALATVHAAVEGEPSFTHGDFWLGNLLVDGEHVTGVIDWTECVDGEPAADLTYLVESLIKVRPDLAGRRIELVAAADRGFFGSSAPVSPRAT